MSGAVTKQDTLHDAVRSLARRGCTDPVAIMATLNEQYGQTWLLRQLASVIASIASEGESGRHVNPVTIPPGVPRVRRAAEGQDILSGAVWVHGRGWVALGSLTASDCRTVAEQYDRLAGAALRHRDWFLRAAELIDEEGAATVGDVRMALERPLAPLSLRAVSE